MGGERLQGIAPSGGQGAAAGEQKGGVHTDGVGGQGGQFGRGQVELPEPVEYAQGSGGVGGAAAQPSGDGDALDDADAGAGDDAAVMGQGRGGAPDQVGLAGQFGPVAVNG